MEVNQKEKYSLVTLVFLAQSYDMERSQAALKEIERRGYSYEELHEQFND